MVNRDSYKYNSKIGEVVVRRGMKDDIPALIDISRISFPDYLPWCTNRQAKKWWESMLLSPFCETWVCEYAGEVVALTRLVTDSDKHSKERKLLRPNLVTLLYLLVTRPCLVIAKIVGRIRAFGSTVERYFDASDIKAMAGKAIWSHSSAVLPKMRKKGIGAILIKFSESRALELKYDSIRAFIEENNKATIRMVETLGFIRTGKSGHEYGYLKVLSPKS